MKNLITLLLLITFTSCTKEVIEEEYIFITEEVKEDLGHNVTKTVPLTSAMNDIHGKNQETRAFYIINRGQFRIKMPNRNNQADLERLEVYTNTNSNFFRLELHSVTEGKVAESNSDSKVLYYKFTKDDTYFFKMTSNIKSKTTFTIRTGAGWTFDIDYKANN